MTDSFYLYENREFRYRNRLFYFFWELDSAAAHD